MADLETKAHADETGCTRTGSSKSEKQIDVQLCELLAQRQSIIACLEIVEQARKRAESIKSFSVPKGETQETHVVASLKELIGLESSKREDEKEDDWIVVPRYSDGW
jgi:flagellar biosynthesis/type III secretory pathway chaperone